MGKQKLENVEQFQQVLSQGKRFLLIKHSLTCPISRAAFHEYEKFAADYPDVDTYYLFVQEARPLSNYIAEMSGVKHESPQALLFENGAVTWHTSHWNITYDALKKQVG
ncbi:bacillithiol system protein YtxJ [Anoxybacillus tepidamans]|uniref:Bacillithiol system protein YtxJ n=1 Tax=Anoxybacteroides tepidamans TaxID=265948 RepID=A0A7W8MVN8_9BACL|nr:bacillithiol system redox-active protein YtxJ [Anoxybacillus tepidamans]MBB5324461.1 bacillithiol system protein YtxJ [Anoxybacillus tepidamans]